MKIPTLPFYIFLLYVSIAAQSVLARGSTAVVFSPSTRYRPDLRNANLQHQYYRPNSSGHVINQHNQAYNVESNWMLDKRSRVWSGFSNRRRNGITWTTGLIAANVLLYGLQLRRPGITSWGVKLSDPILRGKELYRLVSPIFLHGSMVHLFNNMASLNRVGYTTERIYGSGRFAAIYFVSGIAGNILSARNSPRPALGASGAVFGVMSSLLTFLIRNEEFIGRSARHYSDPISQTLCLNLLMGAFNPMIDNWGHLGGAVGGSMMALLFGPRLYMATAPNGSQIIIDRPLLRFPEPIESIPSVIANDIGRLWKTLPSVNMKLFGEDV